MFRANAQALTNSACKNIGLGMNNVAYALQDRGFIITLYHAYMRSQINVYAKLSSSVDATLVNLHCSKFMSILAFFSILRLKILRDFKFQTVCIHRVKLLFLVLFHKFLGHDV